MPPIDAAPLTTVVPGASEAMPPPLPDDPAPPVDELFGQDTNQALPGDMAPDTANQDPVSPDGLDIEDNDPEDPLDQSSYEETTWKPRQQATHKVPVIDAQAACLPDAIAMEGAIESNAENFFGTQLPLNWPDPRGFIPPGPSPVRPECIENYGPVMTHTRIFLGHDAEFTAALAAYVEFRDDARFGGWRSYLERPDDFIRFCCHLHISEMLSARGGATETRVVRHWSNCR
jgi:hypothetical protein